MSDDDGRHLAHANAPETSFDAVPDSGSRAVVKDAIAWLIGNVEGTHPDGLSAPEVRRAYHYLRAEHGWPDQTTVGLQARLSELVHKDGRVLDSGERIRGDHGKLVAVWALNPDPQPIVPHVAPLLRFDAETGDVVGEFPPITSAVGAKIAAAVLPGVSPDDIRRWFDSRGKAESEGRLW